MIEKKIHYCWFGDNVKDNNIINCIKTWQTILPDYEIIEWNELNSEFSSSFSKQALRYKKWAFLSDYIRLKVLYQYGGIYMDTDMLVVKSFEPLLIHQCFLGYQYNGQLNGSIIGCEKGNTFVKACLERYEQMEFNESRLMSMAIPEIITDVFNSYNDKQALAIYTYEYFYPYLFNDSLKGVNYLGSIVPKTYAVHLWNASWFTDKELAGFAFEHGKWLEGFKLFVRYFYQNPKTVLHIPAILFRKIIKRDK